MGIGGRRGPWYYESSIAAPAWQNRGGDSWEWVGQRSIFLESEEWEDGLGISWEGRKPGKGIAFEM